MKTLLFHKTTDAELYKGLQVAYNDTFGQPSLIGKITEVWTFTYPLTYEIDGAGMYLAEELKLIEHEPVNTFNELKNAVNDRGGFVEVTEELFYYALEVLPPIYLKNRCFQLSECYTADLYYTFGEKNGKYYGCLCNKNFALHNF